MKEFLAYHTSKDEAFYLLAIIKDYRIVNKLGYFIMDNNATNNKILRMLSIGIWSINKIFNTNKN
jgi:hypothetical protein